MTGGGVEVAVLCGFFRENLRNVRCGELTRIGGEIGAGGDFAQNPRRPRAAPQVERIIETLRAFGDHIDKLFGD